MTRVATLLALAMLAGGCGPMPRDPDGTLDRVRRDRAFTVGAVAGGTDPRAAAALRLIARTAGAQPAVRSGALEPLLLALERGEIDLVVAARLDPKTPWRTRVALTRPIGPAARDGTREHLAVRNGENAWGMLVDRAARTVARGG